MFGTRLRTWMETHIVRSRKKQHRNKEDKKAGSCSKFANSSASGHIESHSFERQYGKRSPRQNGQDVLEALPTNLGPPSAASMSFQRGHAGHCTVNNLSSPESAYSTGYSTDGTSPGASVPPEYYINIRTGTHYFHAADPAKGANPSLQALVKDTSKVSSSSQPSSSSVSNGALSPRPGRHKREDGCKKKVRQNGDPLPESSTEEDIAERLGRVNLTAGTLVSTPKVKNKLLHPMYNGLHRRTESCDETKRTSSLDSHERDSSDSLPPAAASGVYQCTSPFLPGASPRQRNRIRTNPWLSTQAGVKSYNSQGETSSTVGSSSTMSSNGQTGKQTIEKAPKAAGLSPRPKERRRPAKDMRGISAHNSALVINPVLNAKKHTSAVTTCSPLPNRLCPHSGPLRRSPLPPASSSSPSSSPSSASSEDDHHGNTSDFSDDDVTLNEMLGKFDESYVYEKETDILSDSDPTDCEDHDIKEDRASSNGLPSSEMHEELDFIDQGSLVELDNSDSDFSNKVRLAGHCTYHHLPGDTPDLARKLTPRLRESPARRQPAARARQPRKPAKAKGKDSPLSDRRYHTYRKSSSQSLDKSSSCEAFLKTNSPLPTHRLESGGVRHPGESPAKYMNLNRMLMERIMNNQRNGTRSADGTPVSLRKRGASAKYSGKYMKNHNVANLIDSDMNFNECRSSEEPFLQDEGKPRSTSLSIYSNQLVNNGPRTPSQPGLNELDKEGDLKYRQLIQEAEHIIEDLQVKSRAEYLSPTFRCKNGMERAKPSSPLVFSVPPSPLSLRYDVYKDGYETPPTDRRERSNNNCIFDRPAYADQAMYALQKEKSNENEEGLLRSISKTLERIIVRGTSNDTNKKLDKSVSDPFAKGKKTFVLPAPPIYANGTIENNCSLENITPIGYRTPNLLRRSSSGTSHTSMKLNTCNISSSKLNQNDISNQSGFKKFFKKHDKSRNSSIEHLDKHNFPENGFCITVSNNDPEGIYENSEVYKDMAKDDVHNMKYVERSCLTDFSPNGNTPIYANGFQQVPWQHRMSQAERLKNLSDLRDSPKRKTDSPDLQFERKPALASFSSFDLGNKHVASSRYCPQSEPVKRKIYKCSATFDKLQKSLLKKQPGIHPSKGTPEAQYKETNCGKLKLRVAQLRRETSRTEAKLFETQVQGSDQILTTGVIGTG